MNKRTCRPVWVALLTAAFFLMSGCSQKNRPVGLTWEGSAAVRINKTAFNEYMPGLYHNVIVLKFKNPVP